MTKEKRWDFEKEEAEALLTRGQVREGLKDVRLLCLWPRPKGSLSLRRRNTGSDGGSKLDANS